MKFDDQLAAYLYENKHLQLEGIGKFTLDSKVSVPHEQEKEIYYPIEGLSFNYNPKEETNEDVIVYLVKKLHKIQPLIKSDLESYLSNIRQFINIGKPYTIEGVGTLSKNNSGAFEFTPGNFLPVKEELNPKRENDEHNYPVRSQSSAGKIFVVILVVIAALAALGGIGWGISHLLQNKKQNVDETEQQQGVVDTLPQPAAETAKTSIAAGSDTSQANMSMRPKEISNTSGDSTRYKMIFEITTLKERANRRTRQLHTYHHNSQYDTLRVNNVLQYRLFLPVRIKPADTTRVKDSLSVFLGSRVKVEKQ